MNKRLIGAVILGILAGGYSLASAGVPASAVQISPALRAQASASLSSLALDLQSLLRAEREEALTRDTLSAELVMLGSSVEKFQHITVNTQEERTILAHLMHIIQSNIVAWDGMVGRMAAVRAETSMRLTALGQKLSELEVMLRGIP